jgi:hypothetical protein
MPSGTETPLFSCTAGNSLRQCALGQAIEIARHTQTNLRDGFQDGAGVQSCQIKVEPLSALRALRIFTDPTLRAVHPAVTKGDDVAAGEVHFVFLGWRRLHTQTMPPPLRYVYTIRKRIFTGANGHEKPPGCRAGFGVGHAQQA